MVEEYITYAHKNDPDGNRFRSLKGDHIPIWAVNIRDESDKEDVAIIEKISNLEAIAWVRPSEIDGLESSGFGTIWATPGGTEQYRNTYKALVYKEEHEKEIIAERIVSDVLQDALKDEIEKLKKEVASLKETNRDLNRRAQEAESKAFQNGGAVYKKFEFIIAENSRLRKENEWNELRVRGLRNKLKEKGA
ncbi:hypothetical protein phiOC_p321 [Ochrobactrum phage vB_OspM_OC]|nr:hypothetical protein phiOC_p321 [Ochrobactrum phage vB_OspM_OC]